MLRTVFLLVVVASAAAWTPVAAGQEPPVPPDAAVESLEPDAGPDRLRFLFRAGATWADLRGRVVFDGLGPLPFEGDFGFVVGGAIELRLSDHLSFQPESLIVRRFARVEIETRDGRQSKLSSHYLELPVYLKWYPSGRSGARTNVVVGAVPGLLLGATREIRDGNQIQDVPARDLLAELDWSLGIGGGFEFSEAFANFTVDLRYVHGLTDMNATGSIATARWSTIQLVTGIAF